MSRSREVLVGILVGSMLLSVIAIAASAYSWTQGSAPNTPILLAERVGPVPDSLELDVPTTRIDMRPLSTALDAAYAMGRSSVPLTLDESEAVAQYLLARAAREGRDEPPTHVAWRGETYRLELR